MKTIIISILAVLMFTFTSLTAFSTNGNPTGPSGKAALSGKVVDKKTGESLAGALIQIKGTDIKIYSDLDGNFNLNNIEPGKYSLEVKYISYSTTEIQNINFSAGESTKLEIEILPN